MSSHHPEDCPFKETAEDNLIEPPYCSHCVPSPFEAKPTVRESTVTVRHEIQEFAFALERRLRANERGEGAKSGWELMSVADCLERADEEREELREAFNHGLNSSVKKVRHEIEDTVNFLFFAWYNCEEEFS